jgi:tRNA uridine 5-carbamoylmethylation protein Kti12
MKKLLFISGPAGIGKSTYCRNYINEHPEEKCKIISSDEIRRGLTGSYKEFLPGKDNAAKEDDVTVMLDTTMLFDERRVYFLDNISGYDYKELDLLKLHDYSICLKRNHERIQEKWVPEEVIQSMIDGYEDPSKEVSARFDQVKTIYLD